MKPVIVLGGGGHAKVVVDALLVAGFEVPGFLDRNPSIKTLLGLKQLGDATPSSIKAWLPTEVQLANGFGFIGKGRLRRDQFERWKHAGFSFLTLCHPETVLGSGVDLGEGVQVMAGTIIQPEAVIGDNSIINTRAVIEHDCHIGKHVHIAPGVTLSGGVRVGDNTLIGVGAIVIEGMEIGKNCIVGAGSVVVRDVPDDTRVMGVPAHRRSSRLPG